MSGTFQAEDTLWAKGQGGMVQGGMETDFRVGRRRRHPHGDGIGFISCLFSLIWWSNQSLSLSFSVKCLLCFMFCWGCVWKRFISSWVQLQWKCPVWQIEELDYNPLSLKARAVAVTSNIPHCGGRTGGRCWYRAAGCVDLKIIWQHRAVLPSWLINVALRWALGVFSEEDLGRRYQGLPRQRSAGYRRWANIFYWKN